MLRSCGIVDPVVCVLVLDSSSSFLLSWSSCRSLWVRIISVGAFASSGIVRFALLRHPWRSYSVFVKFVWLVLLVSHYQLLFLVSLFCSVHPVFLFCGLRISPLPRIYVRFGAVVGLLVIDSVGLDLQLETVCDCQGTLLLADERCFAFFVPVSIPGIESSIHRYPCASFNAGCNTKGYRALLTAKVPENILILLSW